MQERHKLDEILFCPAQFSPHKQDKQPLAPAEHRSQMVLAAISPLKNFNILEYELEKQGPSFTIDSLKMLKTAYPDCAFFLILGELKGLESWKEVENLLSLAQPLVGRRSEKPEPIPLFLSENGKKAIQRGMTPMSVMEISSTEIRERLKQKKYCGHLVPEIVLKYIYEHGLYH
jgi:nicotinate-nucleotide adenylyltransferase